MKLSYTDLHCDTAFEMFRSRQLLDENTLSVSSSKGKCFSSYRQVMAVWSDQKKTDDDAYAYSLRVIQYLHDTYDDNDSFPEILLAIEDARILNCHLERLAYLYSLGVRILTLLWSGVTCIGGSYDTETGLSDFGKKVVNACFSMGIIPDISHASEASVYDVFACNTRKLPVIASHSAFSAVHSHRRNVTDEQFASIMMTDGIVGLTLCPDHLGLRTDVSEIDTVFSHIDHALSLGGVNHLGLGCDFDGMTPPKSIPDISYLYRIADVMLQHNYAENIVHKIFYQNAERVLYSIIKTKEGTTS